MRVESLRNKEQTARKGLGELRTRSQPPGEQEANRSKGTKHKQQTVRKRLGDLSNRSKPLEND